MNIESNETEWGTVGNIEEQNKVGAKPSSSGEHSKTTGEQREPALYRS